MVRGAVRPPLPPPSPQLGVASRVTVTRPLHVRYTPLPTAVGRASRAPAAGVARALSPPRRAEAAPRPDRRQGERLIRCGLRGGGGLCGGAGCSRNGRQERPGAVDVARHSRLAGGQQVGQSLAEFSLVENLERGRGPRVGAGPPPSSLPGSLLCASLCGRVLVTSLQLVLATAHEACRRQSLRRVGPLLQ